MLSLAGHALQKDTSLIGIFLLLTRNFLFFRYCLNKQLELARNGQKNGYIVIVPTKKNYPPREGPNECLDTY